MPRVPSYDSFQVAPTAQPQTRFTSTDTPDIAGTQARQFGDGMMNAGRAVGSIALDMQAQANQLRVDDALNKAKEESLRLTYDKDAGFTNLKGINALERPDGKPLADEYGENLKKTITSLSESLGNDAQRQTFALHSNDILTSFRGQAIQHESSEFKTYSLSVAEGVQATALRDIELNWNNPDAVDSAVQRIQAETYRQASLLGKSAEWQEAQSRKLTSNAHKGGIMAALESNDVSYAEGYLKKYSGQMDAADILAVRGRITKEMDIRAGVAVAGEVMQKAGPKIQTSDAERAFNIAVGTESGGKQFGRDGLPLTSPKGAIGIAQLMPATAKEWAEKSGLGWDEARYKIDASYNKAVGMWGFQSLLQQTGGDLAQAYAAYNAGPGRLQEAMKKAEQSVKLNQGDPTVPARTWLEFMPKETRDYVAKNMKAYEAGQGAEKSPTFAEIDDQLRVDPRLAGSPARYKVAREEAGRRFEETQKAIKQRDEEAVATAMRGVIENGGRWTDLPPSIRNAVPPKEVDNLIGFAQKISKGDDTTSLWLYSKLSNNPAALARMGENEFFALRKELSEADFKHFSNERSKLTGTASGGNGPGDLNSQAIKSAVDDRLRMLGTDPTPKDGSDEAGRVGGMRKYFNEYFLSAQREAGKKFTDAEVNQHVDALFAKNATVKGWFSTSSVPMLNMKVGDIDSPTRDNIKAAYKRQGIDNPTDAQILNAFWNIKTARK